jgi:hypothetical protein
MWIPASYERPEESPMERHLALLVFMASFLYLYLFRDYTAMDPDEGIILQGAERILRGQVLYRDFFSFFTPGSYYLLALLFKIFFRAILPVLRVLVLTCFGSFALGMLLRNLEANVRVWTRRGVIRTAAPDGVLEYVQAHVTAGSRILVYPYLPLYYYLTDTFSPTSYEYIQPGMHTREQMTEVARDLASARTPVVLYDYSFAEQIPEAWPNTPIEFIARDPIADLILGRYRNCQMLNSAAGRRVLLMVRKDLKCPAESKVE